MSLVALMDWLTHNWAFVGGILTLLLVSLPGVWLKWQQEKRHQREERSKWQKLVTKANNLAKKGEILLQFRERREDAEKMLLEAIEIYQEATPLDRPSRQEVADLWFRIGKAYSQIGWIDYAEDALKKAVQCWGQHPEAWYELAMVQISFSEPLKDREAIQSLRKHLQINPFDEDARSFLKELEKTVSGTQQLTQLKSEEVL